MSIKKYSYKQLFKIRKIKYKRARLNLSPQRKGIVLRLRVVTPRKPNSARRPIVKSFLTTNKIALAHIPGSGHTLRKHCKVLINGVGARDVPFVNYSCIRGVLDFEPLLKKKRRSIYGAKKPKELITHIRRCYREFVS